MGAAAGGRVRSRAAAARGGRRGCRRGTASPSAMRSATACSRRSAACWRPCADRRGAPADAVRAVAHACSIAYSSCSSRKRAGSCPCGTRSIATATPSIRSSSTLLAGRPLPGHLAGPPGDLAARPRGLLRRRAEGHRVQRTALLASHGVGASIAHSIDDRVMEQAVLAVSTTTTAGFGRARIAYGDLDVEQLGAVYEHVLDYEPAASRPAVLGRTRDARKSTGTFYTPRAVTDYLVRRTLDPLTADRTSDDILSSAFSTRQWAAAHFSWRHAAISRVRRRGAGFARARGIRPTSRPADRAALRRDDRAALPVRRRPEPDGGAARAPVDLAGHARGRQAAHVSRPSPRRRQQPRRRDASTTCGGSRAAGAASARRRAVPLPLFDATPQRRCSSDAVRARLRLASEPDDSAAIVRAQGAGAGGAPRSRRRRSVAGRRVLDLWCAGWFWDDGDAPDPACSASSATPSGRHARRCPIASRRTLAGACRRGGRAPSLSPLAARVSGGVLRRAAARRWQSGLRRRRRQPAVGHGARRQRRGARPRRDAATTRGA